MSESNSPDGKSGGQRKKSSRRRRPRNRKNGPKKGNASGQLQTNESRGQSGQRRGNKKRGPRGPKLSGFEKVERGYLNLLEKHLESRKKYYALYHRADPRQLAKLEKAFYRTLGEMREYEENIKPEFKEEFNQKFDGLKLDTTYSENHELDPSPTKVTEEDVTIEDPHLLPSQVDHEFKGDEEESVGSIEDYQRYKGL